VAADVAAALRDTWPGAAVARAAHAAGVDLTGVWVVGGAVRDALLGLRGSVDLDIVVVPAGGEGADAGPRFARALEQSLADARLKATHTFGTATVLVPPAALADDAPAGVVVDIATARTETYAAPGVLPDIEPATDITTDMARRDVTINAMAWPMSALLDDADVDATALVDPHGGLVDLAARRVRVLHDASFVDDPTRIFRVARMAARFGEVDDHTRSLIDDAVRGGALDTISPQRITTELRIALRAADPAETFVLLWEWRVLDAIGMDPGDDPATLVEVLRSPVDPLAPEDTIELSRLAAVLFACGLDTLPACIEIPARNAEEVVATARLARTLRDAQARAVGDNAIGADIDTLRTLRDCDPAAIVMLGAIGAAPARELLQVRPALTVKVTGQTLLDLGLEPGPAGGAVLADRGERKLRGELQTLEDELTVARQLVTIRKAQGGS
jgi:tRNA nucleotidyltransferase (CCA-adding enzyme)